MAYLKLATNEYPLYLLDMQNENEGWDETQPLPDGWVEVTTMPLPELGEREYLTEEAPIEIDGEWQQNYVVKTYTDDEWAIVEADRTRREELRAEGYNTLEIQDILRNEALGIQQVKCQLAGSRSLLVTVARSIC